MMIHGSPVSRPRGMTGVGSLRNHHRQILQLWTDLHCSRLCLGGTPCPWWGCPKPVGIVQGRSLWVSEMDPKSHCCQKVADVSCLLKVGFASSLRNFPLPWLHRYWARVVWRKKQHQTTKGQLLQILQPGCFKTKGWNQLRLPGYRCKIFFGFWTPFWTFQLSHNRWWPSWNKRPWRCWVKGQMLHKRWRAWSTRR